MLNLVNILVRQPLFIVSLIPLSPECCYQLDSVIYLHWWGSKRIQNPRQRIWYPCAVVDVVLLVLHCSSFRDHGPLATFGETKSLDLYVRGGSFHIREGLTTLAFALRVFGRIRIGLNLPTLAFTGLTRNHGEPGWLTSEIMWGLLVCEGQLTSS